MASQKIHFISAETIEALLPVSKAIELVENAAAAVSRGDVIQPIRTGIVIPPGGRILGTMPGYMKEPECLGVKVLTIFPDNFGPRVPSHQGLMLLFDPKSGSPLGVIDAHTLTNIRTAAASAVATKLLARRDAKRMLVLGYGNLAKAHLAALAHVRSLTEVFVWGRSFDRVARFVSEESKKHAFRIAPIRNVDEATAQVDIICTVTAAVEPILHGRWLKEGVHVNLVGSSTPKGREIDSAGVATGKFYVDARPAALALGGELIAAIKEGAVTEAHIVGEIGDVVLGRCEGRKSEREITIFKSLGMIAQDLICALYVLEAARA